jgi:hypothetical protein
VIALGGLELRRFRNRIRGSLPLLLLGTLVFCALLAFSFTRGPVAVDDRLGDRAASAMMALLFGAVAFGVARKRTPLRARHAADEAMWSIAGVPLRARDALGHVRRLTSTFMRCAPLAALATPWAGVRLAAGTLLAALAFDYAVFVMVLASLRWSARAGGRSNIVLAIGATVAVGFAWRSIQPNAPGADVLLLGHGLRLDVAAVALVTAACALVARPSTDAEPAFVATPGAARTGRLFGAGSAAAFGKRLLQYSRVSSASTVAVLAGVYLVASASAVQWLVRHGVAPSVYLACVVAVLALIAALVPGSLLHELRLPLFLNAQPKLGRSFAAFVLAEVTAFLAVTAPSIAVAALNAPGDAAVAFAVSLAAVLVIRGVACLTETVTRDETLLGPALRLALSVSAAAAIATAASAVAPSLAARVVVATALAFLTAWGCCELAAFRVVRRGPDAVLGAG